MWESISAADRSSMRPMREPVLSFPMQAIVPFSQSEGFSDNKIRWNNRRQCPGKGIAAFSCVTAKLHSCQTFLFLEKKIDKWNVVYHKQSPSKNIQKSKNVWKLRRKVIHIYKVRKNGIFDLYTELSTLSTNEITKRCIINLSIFVKKICEVVIKEEKGKMLSFETINWNWVKTVMNFNEKLGIVA